MGNGGVVTRFSFHRATAQAVFPAEAELNAAFGLASNR